MEEKEEMLAISKCDICGFEGDDSKFSNSILYREDLYPEIKKEFGKTSFEICKICFIKSRGIKTLAQKAEKRSSTARMYGGRGLGKDNLGKDIDTSAGCPR